MKICPLCGKEGPEDYCPDDGTRRIEPSDKDLNDPLVGTLVAGRYAITKKLGEGGMGAVYVANQALVDRPVVVKVLKKEMVDDQELVARFLQEARAASRVVHPNVVTIHDFGYTDDDMAYLVMEFIEGRDLDEILKESAPLPWRRAARILSQVAGALAEAHAIGIVHRDVKPQNVLVTERSDGRDFVKVVDFGLAKLRDAGSTKLTKTGQVMGTPTYMSPEQIGGEDVGPPTDVYALGIMAYHLLAGRPPFDGETVLALLAAHVMEAPPPLEDVVPEAEIPGELRQIIYDCIAKEPAERPANIADVQTRLEALLVGTPDTSARPTVVSEQETAGSERATVAATTTPALQARETEVNTPAAAAGVQDAPTALATGPPPQKKRKIGQIVAMGSVGLLVAVGVIVALEMTSGKNGDDPSAAAAEAVAPTKEAATTEPAEAPKPDAATLAADSTGAGTEEAAAPAAPKLSLPAPRGFRLDGIPQQ